MPILGTYRCHYNYFVFLIFYFIENYYINFSRFLQFLNFALYYLFFMAYIELMVIFTVLLGSIVALPVEYLLRT